MLSPGVSRYIDGKRRAFVTLVGNVCTVLKGELVRKKSLSFAMYLVDGVRVPKKCWERKKLLEYTGAKFEAVTVHRQ